MPRGVGGVAGWRGWDLLRWLAGYMSPSLLFAGVVLIFTVMASFNKVILMGNLTRDPELRVTPAGMSICKFGIAVNRRFNTKEGEAREEVTYVDIDAFGRQAEVIAKHLGKGQPIHIEGRLKLDQWETKEGEKRSRLGVVLEGFQFVGGGSGEGGSGEGGGSRGGNRSGGYEDTSPPVRGNSAAPASGDIDEDVPF